MREEECQLFLREVCLFLDWEVKESWKEASSEKELHGGEVILGQRALGESHVKGICFFKWLLSYNTKVSLSPVGVGMTQNINK